MLHRLRAAHITSATAPAGSHVQRYFATAKKSEGLQEKLVALCRHRGFVFPGSEIYGGLANSFDYGPLGTISLVAAMQ